MSVVEDLVERIKSLPVTFFWQGAASPEAVNELERLVANPLPPSFREFLALTGGGGVLGSEISGIEDNDPTLEYAGTVLGDTLRCREEFGLPAHLTVVYFSNDEICWCLDSSAVGANQEPPVVSYSLSGRSVDARIAPSFPGFLEQYVEARSKADP